MLEKLSRMREKRSQDDGFTLIELLVVVVIIGILIAIAIPLYLNYEKGAQNKSAASDLRGAISTLEQCFSDSTTQSYPTSQIGPTTTSPVKPITGCATPQAQINLSAGTSFAYYPGGGSPVSSYTIVTTHGTNGVFYCYTSVAGGGVASSTSNTNGYVATCPTS